MTFIDKLNCISEELETSGAFIRLMTLPIACAIQLNIFLTPCVQKNSKPGEVRTTGSAMLLTSTAQSSGSMAVSILSTLWYLRHN